MNIEELAEKYSAFPGARVTFDGFQMNVVCCTAYRTFLENVHACFQALSILSCLSIDDLTNSTEGITIEAFRSS